MRDFNVVIIGAGPAGAMVANCLADLGDVLLLDKADFPRSKVCGCCVNAAALDQLERSGLRHVTDNGVPLDALHLMVDQRLIRLPLPSGVSLSRETFDQNLVLAAVNAGVTFWAGCSAQVESISDHQCIVRTASTAHSGIVTGKVVVVADGLGGIALQNFPQFRSHSRPDSKIGVGARIDTAPGFYEPGKIFMAYGGRRGYAGVVALEDGTFDIAAALSVKDAPTISASIENILRDAGMPQMPGLHQLQWRGTKPLTSRRHDVAGTRLFVIGDSASYVEPFTGEGIAWALASARTVAPLVRKALLVSEWNELLAAEWRYLHRNVIRGRQQTSQLMATLLRQPAISTPIASIFERTNVLARPFISKVNAPIDTGGRRG